MTEARLDPYAVLGVARDASPRQIQQAYRRLAKRYHPDLQRAPRTTEQMRRLNQAWAILSNPARRARHDAGHVPSTPARADAWSGAPRRAWQATSGAPYSAWQAASAAPPRHSSTAERVQQPIEHPWLTVAMTIVAAVAVIWLVIGAALFGGLPLPLIGLVLFAVTRSAFGRQP